MDKFLKKNYKIIIMALLILFLFKSMQSCVRNESIERTKNTLTEEKDSIIAQKSMIQSKLHDSISVLNDSIKLLNFRIKLYKEKASGAEQRAIAVQSTAEKIKSHTTVRIRKEKKDSTKKNSIPK